MAVWLVRAGRRGEREDLALQENVVVIGWQELPDLAGIQSREALEVLYRDVYPDTKPRVLINFVGQIWAFCGRIQTSDLVVLPLKMRSALAIGRVVGPYQYRPDLPEDAKHTRPVTWLSSDLPLQPSTRTFCSHSEPP